MERCVSQVRLAEFGPAKITGVVEELVASQSNADGNGKREPLQLEGGSSSDQNGRGDVDASNVLAMTLKGSFTSVFPSKESACGSLAKITIIPPTVYVSPNAHFW